MTLDPLEEECRELEREVRERELGRMYLEASPEKQRLIRRWMKWGILNPDMVRRGIFRACADP